MQNKFLHQLICLSIFFGATIAGAQDGGEFLLPEMESNITLEQNTDNTPDLSNRQPVDFPARTSLDSMELATLPGIYETNITGPAPMAPSVSTKDMPSERLIGLLTPEVFKEMAELERDNTFLKLQIQKETMKNNLETLRANYRQARLDEIAKREDLVRTRIQWWQEQERIRQDMENERAAAEAAKIDQDFQPAPVAVVEPAHQADDEDLGLGMGIDDEITEANIPADENAEPAKKPLKRRYSLVDVMGTRGNLNAHLKSLDSGRVISVRMGDKLSDGSQVETISATQVILVRDGERIAIVFDEV